MLVEKYYFVPDFKTYSQEIEQALTCQAVPLIDPFDKRRSGRWKRVLSSYGLSMIDSCPEPVSEKSGDSSARAFARPSLILGTSGSYHAFAEILARLFKTDLIDLEKFFETTDSTVELITIAHPAEIKGRVLRELSKKTELLSILTALDLEGLCFLFAKQLVEGENSYAGTLVIDALFKQICILDQQSESIESCEFSRKNLDELLSRSWKNLILQAHGEGAHVNLDSVVICGLPRETEHDFSGFEIAACQNNETRVQCKRVWDDKVRIVQASDLLAQNICLLSCNGFSVAGELYPSECSILLGLGEGYACTFVANDSSIKFNNKNALVTGRVANLAGDFEKVLRFTNDVCFQQYKRRSFFVHGIAHLLVPENKNPLQYNEFAIEATALQDKEVISLRPSRDDCIRGHRAIYFLNKQVCSIPEFDQRWAETFSWFSELQDRLLWSDFFLQSLNQFYFQKLARESEFEQLNELERKQSLIRSICFQGFYELERIHRHALWSNLVIEHLLDCAKAVNEWDSLVGKLCSILLFEGEFEECLSFACRLQPESESKRKCRRCCSDLSSLQAIHPASKLKYSFLECLTCGPLDSFPDSSGILDICLPQFCRPGQELTLNLTFGKEKLNGIEPGCTVLEFKDKGKGKVIERVMERPGQKKFQYRFKLPADLSFDLHTVRIALVRGLKIYLSRRRLACIPANLGEQ